MTFKSLPQLLDHFKEEKTCIAYYEQLRWNGKPVCPHCNKSDKPYKTKRGYRCSNGECKKDFTVRVGTIFENTKISFRIWFAAIYLQTAHKKGISSLQLSRDLDITQKTAWFVLHRIREMLKCQAPTLVGENKIVESDATFIGGKEGNKHYNKRVKRENENASPFDGKKAVLGIIERNGRVVLKYVPSESEKHMVDFVNKYVPVGAKIYTDEHYGYKTLGKRFVHNTVNHNIRIYVDGDIHTNTIENFWSVLKRGLYGIYHSVSAKHLDRYLHEFSSRFNERNVSEQVRFEKFLLQSEKRLAYKNLIA